MGVVDRLKLPRSAIMAAVAASAAAMIIDAPLAYRGRAPKQHNHNAAKQAAAKRARKITRRKP